MNKHAEMFNARLRKNQKRLASWAKKQKLTSYRIYERDIPEIPVAVDNYDGDYVIYFFEAEHREYTKDASWQREMAACVEQACGVDSRKVFIKSRTSSSEQTTREVGLETIKVVQERGLKFRVELATRLDTGLYLDHREARQYVKKNSKGKRVLNLFSYTASFSVYAGAGGAKRVTSVDGSGVYCGWARRNLVLNDLDPEHHVVEQGDCREYLRFVEKRFDLIVCDPPTFSVKKGKDVFDVQRDYVDLLDLCLKRTAKGGQVLFSTNRRKFQFDPYMFRAKVEEKTEEFAPRDFKRFPRTWLLSK